MFYYLLTLILYFIKNKKFLI